MDGPDWGIHAEIKAGSKTIHAVLTQTLIAQCRLRGATIEIRAEGGMIYVSGDQDEEIVDALKHTFGVTAVDPYTEVELDRGGCRIGT